MGHVLKLNRTPGSLHQRIIADRKLGLQQRQIAKRQGCSQSTVSDVLAAAGMRTYKKKLYRTAPEERADQRRWAVTQEAISRVHMGSLVVRQIERTAKEIGTMKTSLNNIKRNHGHIAAGTLDDLDKAIETLRAKIDELAAYAAEQPRWESKADAMARSTKH